MHDGEHGSTRSNDPGLPRRRILELLTVSSAWLVVRDTHAASRQSASPTSGAACTASIQALLDQYAQQYQAALDANCVPGDCDCLVPITAAELAGFDAQLESIDAASDSCSCASTSDDAELIALSNAMADVPGLVSLLQYSGIPIRPQVCAIAPPTGQIPVFGGPMLALTAMAAAGTALWMIRRRRPEGRDGSAAAGGLVLVASLSALEARAQAVTLFDILLDVFDDYVPYQAARCLARLLSVFINVVVPVNVALEFATALSNARNEPAVQQALSQLIGALEALKTVLKNRSLGTLTSAGKTVVKAFADVADELVKLAPARTAAENMGKALAKSAIKAVGVVILGYSYIKAIHANWDDIKADCACN